MNKLTIILAISLCSANLALADAIIYEPFVSEVTDGSLHDITTGQGLSGTWSGSAGVDSSTLDFGDLQQGGGGSVFLNNQFCAASVGTTLTDANLLDDGATLWFSFLIRTGSDIATNGDLGFALGSERIGNRNNIPVANSGDALGVTFKNNQIRASQWGPGSLARTTDNTGNSAGPETLYLIAGKITWGDDSETIEIYNVSLDLALGTPISTHVTPANLNQTTFDTISFGSKAANPNHFADEIRFGATSADVLPTAAGPAIDPIITSITQIDATTYELTIVASADTEFGVAASGVLDFDNSLIVVGLTQGSVDDPGTVSLAGDTITTDENGNATFRMTSATAKNFVRIQPPIAVAQ